MTAKEVKFGTFGPFEVPVRDHSIDRSGRREFWQKVEKAKDGLSGAKGCYVFALRGARGGEKPWYVGLTQGASFKTEIFTAHKEVHLLKEISTSKRPKVVIYLIARLSATGKLRRGTDVLTSIRELEKLLIVAAYRQNKKLRNTIYTKYSKMHVPGFLNDKKEARDGAAKQLHLLLGS